MGKHKMSNAKEVVLVISDTHAPFHHKDTLRFLEAVKKKYKPTRVVHIGDMTDSYHLSDYIKDPDGISAKEEIAGMHKFVNSLVKMFPKMHILIGNHDTRLYRQAQKVGIPLHYLKDYHSWMNCPKQCTISDSIEIDGILYTHGDEQGAGGDNAAIKRAKANFQSTVSGHLHTKADIRFFANRKCLVFGMQTGCLIDHEKYAFAYSKKQLIKPIISCGVVDKGIPTVVPMFLDANGTWIGSL